MAKCSRCGSVKEQKSTSRIPRSWKSLGEELICKTCWNKMYVIRAITFPVAGPVNPADWPSLREMLSKAWGDSTQLANWMVTECVKAERVRLPADEKMWAAPKLYLYPMARAVCPDITPASVVSITNAVQSKFSKSRFGVIWCGNERLPLYKYPYPYPIPGQAWSARWMSETEHVPIVSLSIQGQKFELRLRGGPDFKRLAAQFGQIVSGEAVKCEMQIYRQQVNPSAHRPGVVSHENNGGGEKATSRVMAKLVAWIPRSVAVSEDKVLLLRRGHDCLWIAEMPAHDPWRLNCDWVRSWIIGHRVRLQRMSEDTKYEKRWPSKNRIHINEYREKICLKQNDRLKTFSHTAAKLLAEFAKRQKISTVAYLDDPTPYLPDFPWFSLKDILGHKLHERGIGYEVSVTPCD